MFSMCVLFFSRAIPIFIIESNLYQFVGRNIFINTFYSKNINLSILSGAKNTEIGQYILLENTGNILGRGSGSAMTCRFRLTLGCLLVFCVSLQVLVLQLL